MAKITVTTTRPVVPMIYAYTTPEIKRHDGWTKIGYTEQDVDERIKQQTHTADVEYKKEWQGTALYEDGSGSFTDKDFHGYLRKLGIEKEPGKNNEWFKVTGPVSKGHFYDFRQNHGIIKAEGTSIPYELRKEQETAVAETVRYSADHDAAEFLWNCKPRFGKTLSAYDLCKKVDANNVLIVTNRPAIANSWYDDYVKFLGDESGYKFVSHVDALKGKPYVISREEYISGPALDDYKCIEFVSLQDLKGSKYFNPYSSIDKLGEVAQMEWDVLIIDEAHEGVDTYKTDVAFDQIKRKLTLHLSGTPFKALANEKFEDAAIYNWTYADEQAAKADWTDEDGTENPYETLPKLNLFTYQMSEIIKEELDRGIEIQGETEEYAFDLNEFFKTTANGRFVYESSVDRFLDALTEQTKFPFSTEDLRNELKHTFWLLNRVDSARALAKKLETHPVFKDYEIVLAAGDGRIDDDDENIKSFDKVREAIENYEKTITLSVGQLTTGVTIPEWTAVLMLSNVKSPSLYMQAAFRAQNPCLFNEDGGFKRKENAYVFDFDPARTLIIFEEFANDLYSSTASGKGDSETRKQNVMTLLNFFPVIGEDENGEMIELDAEKVLSIPRKIKSQEVVRRGFMSNYLFQNISNIFGAPREVLDIINQFEPVAEPKIKLKDTMEDMDDIPLDENGDVEIPNEHVIGVSSELFGDKIYGIDDILTPDIIPDPADKEKNAMDIAEKLKEQIKDTVITGIVDTAKDNYEDDLRPSDRKRIEKELERKSDSLVTKTFSDYEIKKNTLEQKREDEILEGGNKEEINAKYDDLQKKAADDFSETLMTTMKEFVEEAKKETVKQVETKIKEREKDTVEDKIRDHLRGFSRTIPSFLMAYGDDTVTLATFDEKVPGNVFVEVTSITIDQFKFLRDGGKYIDEETGEEKEFAGNLFDSVVFDDSVKEFLRLKKKLADYFDEKAIEDIFDYIPPQKTNQIYTPKDVVKKMVDYLEEENPGCFDEPDKTFIDLYMKSGLYITEIVKRLMKSEKMKEEFPDTKERIKHIFAHQVYGLAPTEIIYEIATNYILGFLEDKDSIKHNFKQVDALPYAKEGTLEELLDELFEK